VVDGSREGQKIAAIPFDKSLQLFQSKFFYLLQDWNQALEVEMPFAQVSTTLEHILGCKPSVHSLERSQRAAAQDVEAFWHEQPLPTVIRYVGGQLATNSRATALETPSVFVATSPTMPTVWPMVSIWSAVSRSPPASSKEPVDAWSKTAWKAPGCAG
jgi:hypothetical protein